MTKSARLSAHHDLAGLGSAHAGQAVEQLLLALALQRGDAEHLAETKSEGDVVQSPGAQVAHLDGHRSGRGCAGRRGLGGHLIGHRTEHQLDDAPLTALRRLDDPDGLAVTQHGGAIAQR